MAPAALAALAVACAGAGGEVEAQGGRAATRAPADAPWSTVVAPDEPGERLVVEGTVSGPDGRPLPGASVYAYHTDAGGDYGPGGNRDPWLKAYLRTDESGRYRFETVRPGAYPQGGIAAHIHFHVGPPAGGEQVSEVVFEGDPLVSERMRRNPFFVVRPLERGADGVWRVVYDVRLDER